MIGSCGVRQYEDILLHAMSPEYKGIGRAHLERRDFGLDGIWRMMVTIYANNLSRRSITSADIARLSQTMNRDLSNVQYHNCSMVGY